ncbi:MAG: c-type cytochrome biogenesis protein CcmI [Alphaproteobacteria bacterium]
MILGIVLTVMTLGTAALIALPFLRATGSGHTRRDQELAIYKDQLSEIDRDAERGLIGAEEADAARAEIGRRIIAIDEAGTGETATGRRAPVLAAVTGICVPALALVVICTRAAPICNRRHRSRRNRRRDRALPVSRRAFRNWRTRFRRIPATSKTGSRSAMR